MDKSRPSSDMHPLLCLDLLPPALIPLPPCAQNATGFHVGKVDISSPYFYVVRRGCGVSCTVLERGATELNPSPLMLPSSSPFALNPDS